MRLNKLEIIVNKYFKIIVHWNLKLMAFEGTWWWWFNHEITSFIEYSAPHHLVLNMYSNIRRYLLSWEPYSEENLGIVLNLSDHLKTVINEYNIGVFFWNKYFHCTMPHKLCTVDKTDVIHAQSCNLRIRRL